jgi:hypothetical protein
VAEQLLASQKRLGSMEFIIGWLDWCSGHALNLYSKGPPPISAGLPVVSMHFVGFQGEYWLNVLKWTSSTTFQILTSLSLMNFLSSLDTVLPLWLKQHYQVT